MIFKKLLSKHTFTRKPPLLIRELLCLYCFHVHQRNPFNKQDFVNKSDKKFRMLEKKTTPLSQPTMQMAEYIKYKNWDIRNLFYLGLYVTLFSTCKWQHWNVYRQTIIPKWIDLKLIQNFNTNDMKSPSMLVFLRRIIMKVGGR